MLDDDNNQRWGGGVGGWISIVSAQHDPMRTGTENIHDQQ